MADEETAAPVPCSPCRGTGKVVSHADEKTTDVTCPWCEGSGSYQPGHDAQAHWRSDEPPDQAA